MDGKKIDRAKMDLYAEKAKNWGKWGPNDELGTVNYITPQDIIQAAQLVKRGKVFSLAIPFGSEGPQFGDKGRINPAKTMIATGTDAICGRQDAIRIRYCRRHGHDAHPIRNPLGRLGAHLLREAK